MLFPKLCHGCFPYQRHKSIGTGHWLHSACKEPEYPILPLIGSYPFDSRGTQAQSV